jgi:tRNA threonylcarbamoyladenosine biosynthesis protein TsaE
MQDAEEKKTIEITGEDELEGAAEQLFAFSDEKKIFLLDGPMGAGKTTFTKKILRHLGSKDLVNSPTFSIVNEYLLPVGEVAYHFDFYRIKSEEEALDMGVEEYLYSGCYCFIEWPERIESLLPSSYISIQINPKDQQQRTLTFKRHG